MDVADPVEQSRPTEYWSQLSAKRENSGDYLGACDAALLGLEQHPTCRDLQYRAILNLSRTGANKRAQQLWRHYRLEPDFDRPSLDGHFEENIAALGARLDREEAYAADTAQRPARLKNAAEHYESIYRRTASTFLGINAAVLHELSGDPARAKEIAAAIVGECAKAKPQSQDDAYQLAADRAAASLLLDDLDDTRAAIEDAATLSSSAAAIASTRKQLIQICNHKGLDKSIIAPLRNRVVIHYTGHIIAREGTAGRFPAQAEARVAADIRRELAGCDVGYGYGSLACGADTLIVEALLKRGAEVDVVLPFETLTFVKQSVAVGGANWPDRFENCLKQVRLIHATEGEYVGDPEVFAYASRLAMGLAILRAQQLSSEPIQLAVWDGQETAEKAGSFADIQAWQSQGLKTITIGSDGNLGAKRGKTRRAGVQLSLTTGAQSTRHHVWRLSRLSRLSDRQMLTFYNQMMQRIAAVLDRFAGDVAARNTWGDGLFVVFEDLGAAARCAMQIQSTLAGLDLLSLGLPASLGLRLGLDAGAVFEVQDPILRSPTFTGTHISRTARLEPSTPPGEVYVTEAFAALFTLIEDKELICDYVGLMQAAKNYGRLRTYLLRRRAYA